jgi:hypothetical protein
VNTTINNPLLPPNADTIIIRLLSTLYGGQHPPEEALRANGGRVDGRVSRRDIASAMPSTDITPTNANAPELEAVPRRMQG